MSAMIDTDVLSHALEYDVSAEASTDEERATLRRQKDSEALIRSLDIIRVPAIVMAETYREFPKAELDAIIGPRGIFAVPFTGAMADLAAQTLSAHRARVETCSRCFNAKDSKVCPVCKLAVPKARKTNDAYIVATAILTDGIDVLYSYDSGMIDLCDRMKEILASGPDKSRRESRLVVRKPQLLDGNLFDPEVNPRLVVRGDAPSATAQPPDVARENRAE